MIFSCIYINDTFIDVKVDAGFSRASRRIAFMVINTFANISFPVVSLSHYYQAINLSAAAEVSVPPHKRDLIVRAISQKAAKTNPVEGCIVVLCLILLFFCPTLQRRFY